MEALGRRANGPRASSASATSAARPAHQPGEAVGPAANWVLEKLLGGGAFSEVWLARDRNGAHAPRALKIFTGAGSAQSLKQRQAALRSLARKLSAQPNVVHLLAVAIPAGDARAGTGRRGQPFQPFVAMEYVPGGSLEDWLLEPAGRRPALPRDEVMRDAVAALAAAHRQGIHHGSLRPSRILLTRRPAAPSRGGAGETEERPDVHDAREVRDPRDLRAKVAGFGLADPGASALGADRMYEPPEAWGAGAGWDPMGDDVFALGIVWYQLLAGKAERPPYDFADELAEAGHDPRTIRVLSRCLARPGRRFASAVELDEALGEVGLPSWPPVPGNYFDVSQIVRDYLRERGRRPNVKT